MYSVISWRYTYPLIKILFINLYKTTLNTIHSTQMAQNINSVNLIYFVRLNNIE